jgi:hypothetical protein
MWSLQGTTFVSVRTEEVRSGAVNTVEKQRPSPGVLLPLLLQEVPPAFIKK